MTPAAAAARLNRMANAIAVKVARAAQKSAEQGVVVAKDYSKGPYTLKMLAAMGHPYAQRHGLTRRQRVERYGSRIGREYIVNVQSGRFLRTWRAEPPRSAINGTVSAFAINDSPEARFLKHGTRFMIERPIGPQVTKLLRPIAYDNVREAVRKAMKVK